MKMSASCRPVSPVTVLTQTTNETPNTIFGSEAHDMMLSRPTLQRKLSGALKT